MGNVEKLNDAIKELLQELHKMNVSELKSFREEYKAELEEQGTAPHLIAFSMDVIDVAIERKAGTSNGSL